MILFQYGPGVDRAIAFATKAHSGQLRKFSEELYVNHCVRVVQILIRSGVTDDDVLKASVLHDVLEDCPMVSAEALLEQFGKRVFDLVVELTNAKSDAPRKEHKRAILVHLRSASADAQTIKCADLADNVSDLDKVPDQAWALMYLQEKSDLHAELTKADPVVYAWAERALNKAWDHFDGA